MTTPLPEFRLPAILRPVLPRLVAEHGERLSAETVLRCLAGCHDELHRAGVRAWLNHAAEAMARTRLRQPPAASPATANMPNSRTGPAVSGAAEPHPTRPEPEQRKGPEVSITPDEVRAARAARGPTLPEAGLPEAEIERMAPAVNRHRGARTPTAALAAPESQQT